MRDRRPRGRGLGGLLALLLSLALLGTACGQGSDAQPDPTDGVSDTTGDLTPDDDATNTASTTDTEPAATPTEAPPTPEPTATPIPFEPTDDQRIGAAVAQLEQDGVADLIAWDILDTSVEDTGLVRLTLCGWDGQGVDDEVREARWNTSVDGTDLVATENGSNLTTGDCLNTHLIDTALDFIDVYDRVQAERLANPDRFDEIEPGRILSPRVAPGSAEAIAAYARDGLHVIAAVRPGDVRTDVERDILWRRLDGPDGAPRMEMVVCRQIDPEHGVYAGDTLIDNARPEGRTATQVVTRYGFVRINGEWRNDGINESIWIECETPDNWTDQVERWTGGPQWMVVE